MMCLSSSRYDLFPRRNYKALTIKASSVLVLCQPRQCRHLFLASLSEPSVHTAICNESFREPFSGRDVLLCSSNSTKSPLRCPGLCGEIHYRNSQVLSALCSPDHMEYEGKRLQGRRFHNCKYQRLRLRNKLIMNSPMPSSQLSIRS